MSLISQIPGATGPDATGLDQLRALIASGRRPGIAVSLDSACGCAVHANLDAGHGYTTLEIKVAYHKALTDQVGKVRAEGRVLSMGKRVAFAEGKLVDAAGTVYATATSTLLVMATKR